MGFTVFFRRHRGFPAVAAAALLGCPSSSGSVTGQQDIQCTIPKALIFDGGPGKDGIPALTNPTFVSPDDPGATYLREQDRVIGLLVDGQPLAVPLNIEWWHEIVNLDRGEAHLAISHCPLTGSSLVFDRTGLGDAEFGVSGLLFMNNLIMYDRTADESLWPQMLRGARCGSRTGTDLQTYPALELTWAGWKSLHPDTKVVSSQTGIPRDYTSYPYGNYDQPGNPELLFSMPNGIDTRRPPKERVLGIPQSPDGGIGFPFGALESLGDVGVVDTAIGDQRVVVFWDGARSAAAAFYPTAATSRLTFRIEGGQIVDSQSGTVWRIDGLATSGAMAGTRLPAVTEAFVAYWFAWAAFYPEAQLWTAGAGSASR